MNGQDFTIPNVQGVAINENRVSFDVRRDHPKSALAQYIEQTNLLSRNATITAFSPVKDNGFIGRMSELSHIFGIWTTGGYAGWDQNRRVAELKRVTDYVAKAGNAQSSWFAMELVQNYTGGSYQEAREALATMMSKLQDSSGLPYWCRYEIARSRYNTQKYVEARQLFTELYKQTLAAGILAPFDSHFYSSFTSDQNGQAQWRALVTETVNDVLKRGGPTTLIKLAWQFRQYADSASADQALNEALGAMNKENEFAVRLAAVAYLKNAGDYARAMSLLQPLMADQEENGVRPHFSRSKNPWLWRIMAELAQQRGQLARSIDCEEKALDLELEEAGDKINLQVFRQRFAAILAKYQQLADAMATLEKQADDELVTNVIRAADRWRAIDPEPTQACQAAARVLTAMGHKEWAWDYLTTPLADKSNEAAPWTAMAAELARQGDVTLADRAYATAFEVEPTNAQALWDRAQMLQQAGRMSEARELYRQLANGTWQPRWEHLGRNAKAYLERN
jgi:predicted Zn-dependent protease